MALLMRASVQITPFVNVDSYACATFCVASRTSNYLFLVGRVDQIKTEARN